MSSVEYVEGGLEIEESKAIAQILEDAGVDCIHCSQGVYGSIEHVIPSSSIPKAAYVQNAAQIKEVVSIPVIAVGRINDPLLAESIIASGKADMCTMARASLADPDLPNKAAAGKHQEILHCIGCMQGCIGENEKGNGVRCLMNPMTGMEDEYRFELAKVKKHILVVGGGIAGCETAVIAAQRGHRVTLLEKTGKLGGQWLLAAVPPGKSEFTNLVAWQGYMMEKLGVEVVYHTEANRAMVDSYHPDVVINAIGSNPTMPPVPGLKEYTCTARQVLAGEVEVGKNVVVIGGGLVGAETADHLAVHGHQVTVIEMMPKIMADGEPTPTMLMLRRYAQYGVVTLTSAKVKAIAVDSVTYEKDGAEGSVEHVDTIINAMGRRADQSLLKELEGSGYEVISVGDALEAKSGYLGIREGYEAGLRI
jgi:NADPH-dependent 2,4-dienoyl-CoA reductase/sulfur reductase-like enzyme